MENEINCERTAAAALNSSGGVAILKDVLIQRWAWRTIRARQLREEMSLGGPSILFCPIHATTVASKISICPRRVSVIDGGPEHRMDGYRYWLEGP